MPEPGDRPASHSVRTTDLVWHGLYLPIAAAVGALATRLNGLQFLTIRRYLSLVFLSLILLLLGLTLWNCARHCRPGLQMLIVLALAPGLVGLVRTVKSRLTRQGAEPDPALPRHPAADAQEVVLAENASWLFRVSPYMIFAATWVAAALVPTFAAGLQFGWTADLIAIVALLGSARGSSWRWPAWTWAPASAGSDRAAR